MKQQPFATYSVLRGNNLFRPSKERDLVWEPVPNAKRGLVSINSAGFRGRDFAAEPPTGVSRIAVLGDSETFGEQLREEDTIAGCLQSELARVNPDRKYEVLNFGIVGYNTAQEFSLLKKRVIQYKPSMVIVYYVFNDPEIYSPIQFVKPGKLSKLYLYQFFQYSSLSLRSINEQRIKAGNVVDYFKLLHDSIYFDAVKSVLSEMSTFLAERDIPMVLLIAPEIYEVKDFSANYPYREIHQKLKSLETRQMKVIDPLDEMSRRFTDPKKLWVNPYDQHKNAEATAAIASVAAPEIVTLLGK